MHVGAPRFRITLKSERQQRETRTHLAQSSHRLARHESPSSTLMRQSWLRGFAWTTADSSIGVSVQFGLMIVLSRHQPADFGLYAVAMAPIAIAATIAQLGLGPEVVRRSDDTKHIARVALGVAIASSTLCTAVMLVFALHPTWLGGRQLIGDLMVWLTPVVIVAPIHAICFGLIQHARRFERLAQIRIGALLVNAALASPARSPPGRLGSCDRHAGPATDVGRRLLGHDPPNSCVLQQRCLGPAARLKKLRKSKTDRHRITDTGPARRGERFRRRRRRGSLNEQPTSARLLDHWRWAPWTPASFRALFSAIGSARSSTRVRGRQGDCYAVQRASVDRHHRRRARMDPYSLRSSVGTGRSANPNHGRRASVQVV